MPTVSSTRHYWTIPTRASRAFAISLRDTANAKLPIVSSFILTKAQSSILEIARQWALPKSLLWVAQRSSICISMYRATSIATAIFRSRISTVLCRNSSAAEQHACISTAKKLSSWQRAWASMLQRLKEANTSKPKSPPSKRGFL